MATICQDILSSLLAYETPNIVRVKSRAISAVTRLVQLTVILYILVWVLIIGKGYQLSERGLSAATTRVNGTAYPNISSLPNHVIQQNTRVWDVVDIVVPAEENKAFFVTTSALVTHPQTQSVCLEEKSVVQCSGDKDCQPSGKVFPLGHGVSNGTCNLDTNTCYIEAWCPIAEDNSSNGTIYLPGTKNFTVLIKSHVFFPMYNKRASNVANLNDSYISNCKYHKIYNPTCPVFTLNYIVNETLAKTTPHLTFDNLVTDGAVIAIRIKWSCNLDYNIASCFPTYDFDRLDKGDNSLTSKGYSYEYAHKYNSGGVAYRQLVTASGLLFIITTDAEGGKFAILPMVQNIGAGLALLGIASVICDIILLYFHKHKRLYKAYKYEVVEADDAYKHSVSFDLGKPYGVNDSS